jgi:RNA polymerase sigma-70 factor (ECF subfamily)
MTSFRSTRSASRVDAGTDAELLAAVTAGDLTALGTLYDRHARHVWRVLHRITNGGNDVEDVLHATFLQLPKLARNFDGRSSSCRNWLCGVATRLALRHGRGLARFTAMRSRLGSGSPRATIVDPESQASHREDLRVLERAIASLSPKIRAVFVLLELHGLSHAEVAETLQIPLATVRTRLFGAKEVLRRSLLEHEVEGGGIHE